MKEKISIITDNIKTVAKEIQSIYDISKDNIGHVAQINKKIETIDTT